MKMALGVVALAGVAFAAAPVLGLPKRETRKVVVDGGTYRVSWRAGQVEVAKKSLVVISSLGLRDAMRKAVVAATGCELSDELVLGNILEGRLKCPSDNEHVKG